MSELRIGDYSLTGKDAALAVEKGLAEATWYASPVPKEKMRELLRRRDWPGIRDSIIWFALLIGAGVWGYFWWGHWYAILPFAIYFVIYGSTSDSRWHEAGHGTAFKSDWLNNALYEIASFMVMRESVVWRWSHTRHHSDTIIVGRDPEIAVPRPPDLAAIIMGFFNLKGYSTYFKTILLHCTGRMTPSEKTFIPESEYHKIFFRAWIYVLIYATAIALAIYFRSFLPLMYVGLPNLFGTWLMLVYGLTQHSGLAENVLDHRLNCRTVYMNPVNRFLYWNMNYHVEHHMFPLVPYHALPRLHEVVKADMPRPYNGLIEAWREIIPAVLRQCKDPGFYVKRNIPTPTYPKYAPENAPALTARSKPADGWVEVCEAESLSFEDVVRFDHEHRTYAVYRTASGKFYATDGICTHGNTHLADGMVKGNLIECPKHNGRFDVTDGSPRRRPVCVALQTYPVRVTDGKLFLQLSPEKTRTAAPKHYRLRVIANEHVATYIKELTLEPVDATSMPKYEPGDYLQFEIPAYGEIPFREIAVKKPYCDVWEAQHIFDYKSRNDIVLRRNYSVAANPAKDRHLRFNIRLAAPPRGQDCYGGIGSAFMQRLKPGDIVTSIGPFGDFHIKPTQNEMIYIGGGSGMAPLRSHISHLLETMNSGRRISFWYGARSLQEAFYRDYFEELARKFSNFTYHLALSEPLPEDNWNSRTGLIHEVLFQEYLSKHSSPVGVEYYLCGPPGMVQAAKKMLEELDVPACQLAYDEF